MTTESLKTIVAGCVPHVREALRIYVDEAERNTNTHIHRAARSRVEGYLLAARNSGSLCVAHCDRLLEEVAETDGHRIIAAAFEPTPKLPPVTEGERSLYRYQYKLSGGFNGALWDAIFAADSTNLAAIEKGFPEHVAAYRGYANQPDFWAALRDRIEGGDE